MKNKTVRSVSGTVRKYSGVQEHGWKSHDLHVFLEWSCVKGLKFPGHQFPQLQNKKVVLESFPDVHIWSYDHVMTHLEGKKDTRRRFILKPFPN